MSSTSVNASAYSYIVVLSSTYYHSRLPEILPPSVALSDTFSVSRDFACSSFLGQRGSQANTRRCYREPALNVGLGCAESVLQNGSSLGLCEGASLS